MRRTRLILTQPDGSVNVTSPSPALIMEFLRYGKATGTLLWFGDVQTGPDDVMTLAQAEAAAVAFVRSSDLPPGGVDIREEVGEDTVDGDGHPCIRWADGSTVGRRFRDCYRRVGVGLPRVDMPLARLQRMADVRRERNTRLAASDGEMLKARDQGNGARETALMVYRQALRDLPANAQSAVDAITTPEALHAWTPTWPVAP